MLSARREREVARYTDRKMQQRKKNPREKDIVLLNTHIHTHVLALYSVDILTI